MSSGSSFKVALIYERWLCSNPPACTCQGHDRVIRLGEMLWYVDPGRGNSVTFSFREMAKLYTSEYDVFKGSFLIVQAEFGLLRLQPLGLVHSPLLQYEKTAMSYLTFTVMKGNIKLSNCQRGVVWYMKIAHIVFEVRPGLVECVEWMLQLIFNIARMNEWHCAVSVKYVFRWSERSLQAVVFGVNWWLVLTPLFPPLCTPRLPLLLWVPGGPWWPLQGN